MTVTINVPCRYCQQTEPVRKHGFGKTGEPRYYCRACLRSFQINYRYNAHKQGVKETIVDMALNGSGVSTLKVGINTVIRTLKNSRQNR